MTAPQPEVRFCGFRWTTGEFRRVHFCAETPGHIDQSPLDHVPHRCMCCDANHEEVP